MSNVLQVNEQNFESEVMQSDLPVVVDFYAVWCPPCRALSPILDSLSEHFEGRIKFVKVNSDEEPNLTRQYKVTALPTVVMIHDGKVSGQFSGLPSEKMFREQLEKWVDTHRVPN